MNPEQIASTYNRIAERWDCPEFDRGNGIRQPERALRSLSGHGRALDVGCGSSGRIIDLLLKRGFEVNKSIQPDGFAAAGFKGCG